MGVGNLVSNFMFSVPTNLLQFQQFVYAQSTFMWTKILHNSAFRKPIVITFKVRPNWQCLCCALIARVRNGLNHGRLFGMPPCVRVAVVRDARGLPARLWSFLPSEEAPHPGCLQILPFFRTDVTAFHE